MHDSVFLRMWIKRNCHERLPAPMNPSLTKSTFDSSKGDLGVSFLLLSLVFFVQGEFFFLRESASLLLECEFFFLQRDKWGASCAIGGWLIFFIYYYYYYYYYFPDKKFCFFGPPKREILEFYACFRKGFQMV